MIYFTELQISFKLDVMRISHADIALKKLKRQVKS